MRIFVGGVATEVNTFSPVFMGLEDFRATMCVKNGEHGDKPTLVTAALIELRHRAKTDGFELIEGTTAWAEPGGMLNRQAFEFIRDEILSQLRAAMPVDGVQLCLHGAMVAQGYDDPEGDLIQRIRAIVGDDIPIAATLDLHGQLSSRRVAYSNILVGFKEFPHTDFVERAVECVDLLLRTIRGAIRPAISVFDCRMIDVLPTSWQPMRGFVDRLFELERSDPKVLNAWLNHGFMAGDSPENGVKMLVITDGAKTHGDAIAERLGREVFAFRGQCMPRFLDPDEAIDKALASSGSGRPAVIAEFWDNPGGGTAGDATVILRRLLERKVANVAVGTIWDPIAVKHAFVAGEGAIIPLRFGAKSAPLCGDPIDAMVTVKRTVRNAMQNFGASIVSLGDSVLLDVDGVDVILNTNRAQAFERTLFSNMGVDPEKKDILVIKSSNHFYADFSKLAREVIYARAGHPYPDDPRTNAYRKVPKNVWPRVENPFAAEAEA
jgi:microcystin degradation protein MlrC